MDVLAFLVDAVNNQPNGYLSIAYGGLLHVHREGHLVNNTTRRLYDDDIDLYVSVETMAFISTLEGELFANFGWTVRGFVSRDGRFVIFAQVVATCGHVITTKPGKSRSNEPGIEMYGVITIPLPENGPNMVKDLWQGNLYSESIIFPRKKLALSLGRSQTLTLQLPNQPFSVLECLYGNWREKSSKHAGGRINCSKSVEEDAHISLIHYLESSCGRSV